MSRGRNFVFTLNNPDVLPQPFLDQLVALPNFRYTIFQEERGQEGTIHYQGYLEFSNPKTLAYLKKHVSNRAHFETRKGTAASCIDYCSKEDTRVSGPYSAGTPAQKTQGQRTDLEEACATLAAGGLKRLREELPHMYVKFSRGFEALAAATPMRPREAPEVIVLYGPTGTGKTKYFFDTAPIDESWTLPITSGLWFDGYDSQPHVLLDDFAGRASKMELAHLLRLLDRYPLRVPVKGGFTVWSPTTIYITTNIHPEDWYDYSDRQEHYNALFRRFTRCILYTRDGRCLDSLNDPELLGRFKRKPRGQLTYVHQLGMSILDEPVDQYNYE